MKYKILLILFCLGLSMGEILARQVQPLEESEVPFKVQAWFFKRYNNPTKVEWFKKSSTDKQYYEVSFTHKGRVITSLYETNGAILEETAINKKPIIPETISAHIETKFDKFKPLSLKSIRIFHKNQKEPTVFYQLIGKSDEGNVSVWYDTELNIRQKENNYKYTALN